MTGFELSSRVARLRFRNTEFDGLEITVEYPSFGEYLEIRRDDRKLMDSFAEHAVGWNLTENSEPVDITPASIAALPPDLAISIGGAWLQACSRVVRDSPLAPTEPAASNGVVEMETL